MEGLSSSTNLKPKRITSEDLESNASQAKQRAIEVRRVAWKSRSLYETGGWQALFEQYADQTLRASTKPQKPNLDELANPISSTLCPSSQTNIENSFVFGVVEGTVQEPQVSYLDRSLPLNEDVLALSGSIKPTEMFRIAGSCQHKACRHFDGTDCRLAKRIVQQLPAAVETLPACQIRSNCRWWKQEGKSACFRCPQVVTDSYHASELYQQVADPNLYDSIGELET
jgi:hypothetical protein